MKIVRLYNEDGEHVLSLIDDPDGCENVDLYRPDGTVLYCGVDRDVFEAFVDGFHAAKECYYFTFGVDHFHKKDIVKIYGDVDSTRRTMQRLFGNHWSLQYSEKDVEAQIKKYKYNVIEIGEE